MNPSFSARDTFRSARELLPRVTASEQWENFPHEHLWRILEAERDGSLERSLKIERELVHPLRFNYYYRHRPEQALERWLALHEAVRERFLPSSVPGFLRQLDFQSLERLVRDLDLEERIAIVSLPSSERPDGGFDAYALYYRDR